MIAADLLAKLAGIAARDKKFISKMTNRLQTGALGILTAAEHVDLRLLRAACGTLAADSTDVFVMPARQGPTSIDEIARSRRWTLRLSDYIRSHEIHSTKQRYVRLYHHLQLSLHSPNLFGRIEYALSLEGYEFLSTSVIDVVDILDTNFPKGVRQIVCLNPITEDCQSADDKKHGRKYILRTHSRMVNRKNPSLCLVSISELKALDKKTLAFCAVEENEE